MQVTLTFPAVLERLKLKAFDLCKLIETFVRHELQLPRELKRHMFSIEEKMLESLAWERNSSLFPKLVVACNDIVGAEPCPINLQKIRRSLGKTVHQSIWSTHLPVFANCISSFIVQN